jgi:hypothetical protein
MDDSEEERELAKSLSPQQRTHSSEGTRSSESHSFCSATVFFSDGVLAMSTSFAFVLVLLTSVKCFEGSQANPRDSIFASIPFFSAPLQTEAINTRQEG